MSEKPSGTKCGGGCTFSRLSRWSLLALIAAIFVRELLKSNSYDSVLHRKWKNDSDPLYMAKWLMEFGRPVVLTDTPFDTWNTSKWSPASLGKAVPRVLSKKGKERVFKYFAVDKPFEDFPELSVQKPYTEVVLSGESFFKKLEQSSNGFYYYASGSIELLGLSNLFTNASLKRLSFPSTTTSSGEAESLSQVNFWFGSAGVTAYTHYDTSHNLHMMVYGKKQFLLFPPSHHLKLGLYPSLHQLYRQVQVDILSSSSAGELDPPPYQVTLSPGQALYIPPYWFHCVVSLETSLSLNVWSDSLSFRLMEEVYAQPIPFEEGWGLVTLARALQHMVEALVGSTLSLPAPARSTHSNTRPLSSSSSFVRDSVYARYEGLLAEAGATLSSSVDDIHVYCLNTPLGQVLGEQTVRYIDKRTHEISELLLKVEPDSVREINLANYIEHLGFRIFGALVFEMIIYFRECF